MTSVNRIGYLKTATALFVACLAAPGFCTDGSEECEDNLDIDAYKGVSKEVRRLLVTGTEILDKLSQSRDFRAFGQQTIAAERLLKRAAKKTKTCGLPHYHLGVSYRSTMRYSQAKKWLEKAVEINPQFYEAMVDLAVVRWVLKDFEEALALTERALDACPWYEPAAMLKARCLIRLNRLKKAKGFLKSFRVSKKSKWYFKLNTLKHRFELMRNGPKWDRIHKVESKNYRVMTSDSKRLAKKISETAEEIHSIYKKVFPGIPKPQDNYEIWVYSDQKAYRQAGAPASSLGFYDPLFRRLLLYSQKNFVDTQSTLRRVAFHQYLHDYLDTAPPWFNEGMAEFFGTFKKADGKKGGQMGVNKRLLRVMQNYLRKGIYVPMPYLMRGTTGIIRDSRFTGLLHAQSWSVLHFVAQGPWRGTGPAGPTLAPDYRDDLKKYFRLLRSGKSVAQAYSRTFGEIKMNRFVADWKEFVQGRRGK